jgi:hypothetical protein
MAAEIMEKMHPVYGADIKTHTPDVEVQLNISSEDACEIITKRAGNKRAAPDSFGWTDDMLLPLRAKAHKHALVEWAKFTALLATGDIPNEVAFILTCGTITPLNKLTEEENEKRREAGEEPKLRPTNNGTSVLKAAMRMAAATPSGRRAVQDLLPTQLGLGSKAGPEVVVTRARMLLKANHIISSEDAINGFNATKRQAILDGAHTIWPESTRTFNAYYGKPSIAMFTYYDDEGIKHMKCIRSVEGTRMGCVFGSLGFNMAQEVFIFSKLRKEFEDVITMALTDDYIPVFSPIQKDGVFDWEATYDLVAKFWVRYDFYANPIGIYRNVQKSNLLLPSGAPAPSAKIRAGGVALNYTYDGIVIGGSPIGTDDFIARKADSRLCMVNDKIEKVLTLKDHEPQMALRLLGSCIGTAMDYLTRTTPTQPLQEMIQDFDASMETARMRCLEIGEIPAPPAHAMRTERANMIAQLATRDGGMGHTTLATKAPAGFLAAIMMAANDDICHKFMGNLRGEITYAYEKICQMIGEDSISSGTPMAAVLPPHADDIIDTDFARTFFILTPKVRVQAVITSIISKHRKCAMRMAATVISPHNTESDACRTLALTSRSQMSRLFAAPLCHKENQVDAANFVAYCRFYLMLPQLTIWGNRRVDEEDKDITVEVCRTKHREEHVLDHAGNHASGCTSAFGARNQLHRLINRVWFRAGTSLNLECRIEPPTHELLMNRFSPAEARALFPKVVNKVSQKRSDDIAVLIDQMRKCSDAEEKHRLHQECNKLIAAQLGDSTKGLRVDLLIKIQNNTLWFDGSATHISVRSNRAKVLKFLVNELENDKEDSDERSFNLPTPAVNARNTTKYTRYKPMLNIALMQKARNIRHDDIEFLPLVMTHTGELAPEVFIAIEKLAMEARRQTKVTPSPIGIMPALASAQMRTRIKDGMAAAMATGFGYVLRAAGFPSDGQAVDSQDVGY